MPGTISHKTLFLHLTLLLLLLGLLTGAAASAQDLDDFTFFRDRGYASVIAEDPEGDLFLLQETADTLLAVGEGVFQDGILYEIDDDGIGDDGEEPVAIPLFFEVEETETGFVAFTRDGTRHTFDRLDGPPEKTLFTELFFDPEVDFEVFWQLIAENSIYLQLEGLDWQAVYDTYRPQVDADTTRGELFELLTSLVTLLGDAHHGVLISEDLEREFAYRVPQPSEWLIDRSAEIFELLDAQADSPLQVAGNGRMAYGTFDGGRVGYLALLTFVGFSDDLLTDTEVFTADLDQALADLASTDALVLDLRWNTGGFSHLPRVLLSRFTDEPRLAYRKQARWGAQDTPVQEIFYGPEGTRYTGRPIVGLISDLTSSAGEVAAAMLRELDTVQLVGVPTFGRFSSGLQLALPSGVQLRASNERFFWGDAPGVDLEGLGLVPDILVEPSQQDLDAGVDTFLQSALAALDTTSPGCVASTTTLCLGDDDRFAVQVRWQDFDGGTGAGATAPLTDESGGFWFFDAENVELVVKVLDGGAFNDHFWVFYASLTNVEFTLTVTDTATGDARIYRNPSGNFASRGDTLAFPQGSGQ